MKYISEINTIQSCPTCLSQSSFLCEWNYSGLDQSVFNYVANYYLCSNCGLLFSANISDQELAEFYKLECSYSRKEHFNITSIQNQKKYVEYYNFISTCNLSCDYLLDVGCGRGGFLYWLRQNNLSKYCSGVEFDTRSIKISDLSFNVENDVLNIEQGSAKYLKFDDASQDLLSYFHVWEHIRDLDLVVKELSRVLKPTGGVIIEVPDAENYSTHPIGTAFWLSIREHVNHFTLKSLTLLLEHHGLFVQKFQRKILPASDLAYPSLLIYARKEDKKSNPSNMTYVNIGNYLLESRTKIINIAENVHKLKEKYNSITFWGLSSQMFSLLPMITCDYVLCDADPQKQKSSYRGHKILNPEVVSPRGVLIVASSLHADKIINSAYSLYWKPEQVIQVA